jgi:leucyl/phenylalanyl-tRNA--protein transferase
VALVALTQKLIEDNFKLMDCQIYSRHLQSLGAKTVRRAKFTALLQKYCYGAGEYL